MKLNGGRERGANAMRRKVFMGRLARSVSIARDAATIRRLLTDLEAHPGLSLDGIKHYHFLSLHTQGIGARAAVQFNLLGHWLPGELEVVASNPRRVTLSAGMTQAEIELSFEITEAEHHTDVRLTADYRTRPVRPWRIRTRIKQLMRLDNDAKLLCERFLKALKVAAEKDAGVDEAQVSTRRLSAPTFPLSGVGGSEFGTGAWEV